MAGDRHRGLNVKRGLDFGPLAQPVEIMRGRLVRILVWAIVRIRRVAIALSSKYSGRCTTGVSWEALRGTISNIGASFIYESQEITS